MKRIAGYLLLMMLITLPVQAVGPLAFMAKDFVKGIVKSFVEGQVNQMLTTTGPCGMQVERPGVAGLTGMLSGPGLRSIPGAGAAATVKGARASISGTGGGVAMPPGMEGMMKDQMAQAQAMMAKEQAKHGEGKENFGTPDATAPDMAAAMQAMQDHKPLASAEVVELGTLLERMSTAMPAAESKCKPGDMKAMVQMTSDSPMGGGMLRMMLGPLRDMQKNLDEARATFAKMSEPERREYVETMATEFRGWDKEHKQALLGMVETNFLGMPDTMRTQLLVRLKQAK